jgi:hypothetical protein
VRIDAKALPASRGVRQRGRVTGGGSVQSVCPIYGAEAGSSTVEVESTGENGDLAAGFRRRLAMRDTAHLTG